MKYARKASLWLQANRHLLHARVDEPWPVAASDEEIAAFLDEGTFTYEDKRDHLLFNFNDEADLLIFLRNMGDTVPCNVCLFGNSYLANNVDY